MKLSRFGWISLVLVGLAGCGPDAGAPVLQDMPVWSVGDTWTIETSHQQLMSKTSDNPAFSRTPETLWTFQVDAQGLIDGVDAFRVTVRQAGDDDDYLTLYYRQADLGLIRVEEVPQNKRGGAKLVTRNLFGDAPAVPVVTDNTLVPYNMPAFGQPSGTYRLRAVIEGVGHFNSDVRQQVTRKNGETRVTLRRDETVVEQTWTAGEPFWTEQTVDGRSFATLVSSTDTQALGSGYRFDIDTTTEGTANPGAMPTSGVASYMPWSADVLWDNESGEADGVWSGHWWPMLDGPGKTLLYSEDGPMAKYDRYVQAQTGSVPGARDWEYGNHRTTDNHNGWWGHCNGWAASSVLEDEPVVPGTGEGVYFTVGDKKGLLAEIHNGAGVDLWVGSRHNGRREGDSVVDDPEQASYKDVLPYDLHRTLIEQIGIAGEAVVMDVNPGYQVWNYPAYRYEMSFSDHPDDDKIYVSTTVWFVSFASANYVGLRTHTETYRYWLTINESGEPVPGPSGYTGGSLNDHPDFIWHPNGTGTGNPIKYNRIREIVELGMEQGTDDDHPNTAGDTDADDTLVLGSKLEGNIEQAGDVDYFRFDVEPGFVYTVETSDLGAGSDTFVYMLGTDGTTEIDSDDDGGSGRASLVRMEATVAGTYYVRVRHYSPSGVGTYRIGLEREAVENPEPDDDHPNTIAEVTDADLLSDTAMSASVETSGDVDYFALDAESGRRYTVATANLTGGMDSVLYLFDAQGTQLAMDDDGGSGYASQIEWTATATGRFYVMVRHYGDGTGGYSIRATSVEGGGQDIDAIDLSGGEAAAAISSAGESVLFRFEATAGTSYTVETVDLSSSMDTYMYLLGSDGVTELARDDDSGQGFASRIVWTATTDGTHYVRVRHYSSSGTGSFSVRLTTSN